MPPSSLWYFLLLLGLPLGSALLTGLGGRWLNQRATHLTAVSCIGGAFICALYLLMMFSRAPHQYIHTFYTWLALAPLHPFTITCLIDRLSITLATVVLFISWIVHIYTIIYMADDPGYQRFFSYVSFFTFAMLLLLFANNFLLLFCGWEGVGLASYLLISFWFKREAATSGGLKAFLVNRIGDIGFILGIAGIFYYCGSLNYQTVFQLAPLLAKQVITLAPGVTIHVTTLLCSLLLCGAMGKSAQIPLHVWLPESMAGPTPISALIHAATMVTAGIYLIARLSPLFEFAPVVLNMILIIGATTALLMGILALVQYDIKHIIAYSTLSQLGYMMTALGASAYPVAIFHLITHAFFKALLFLCAGSVILALHHEQDVRKMGGLFAYLPITYCCFAIGALSLAAISPFAGFYSKDMIITSVELSILPAAQYAYYCVLAGTYITSLYIFRVFFLTFHTNERTNPALRAYITEPSWILLCSLLALTFPSIVAGGLLLKPLIFSQLPWFASSLFTLPQHAILPHLAENYHDATIMALAAPATMPGLLAFAGMISAWLFIVVYPQWVTLLKKYFATIYRILIFKYGFDAFNHRIIVHGVKKLGTTLYQMSELKCIDGYAVNGSGRLIRSLSKLGSRLQSGYLYHYALIMMIGILCALCWLMRNA